MTLKEALDISDIVITQTPSRKYVYTRRGLLFECTVNSQPEPIADGLQTSVYWSRTAGSLEEVVDYLPREDQHRGLGFGTLLFNEHDASVMDQLASVDYRREKPFQFEKTRCTCVQSPVKYDTIMS